MTSEPIRIADQLRRAFSGDAWHGSPLRELISGVTAEQAFAHPVPGLHSIWELVAHIDLYVRLAADAIRGTPMPQLYLEGKDWPAIPASDASAWAEATANLFGNSEALAAVIEGFPENRLGDVVPGRSYDYYVLFHGIVQHSLYHAGQIAILKKGRLR